MAASGGWPLMRGKSNIIHSCFPLWTCGRYQGQSNSMLTTEKILKQTYKEDKLLFQIASLLCNLKYVPFLSMSATSFHHLQQKLCDEKNVKLMYLSRITEK